MISRILFNSQRVVSRFSVERNYSLIEKHFPELIGKHILIACFPKSGSSFTARNLAEILGYNFVDLCIPQHERDILISNEQNILHPQLAKYAFKNTVTQNHCVANNSNIFAIKKFNLTVVVLVRNIFDVCISFLDHIHNDFSKYNPIAVIHESFFRLSKKQQLDFIIEMIIPWYFKFFVSWKLIEKSNKIDFLWASYEDMVEDKILYFKKIIDFCGYSIGNNIIEQKVSIKNQPPKRFNKGIIGRGNALTTDQKMKIENYANYYLGIDFTTIGIK